MGYIIKPGKNGEQVMTPIKQNKEQLQALKPFLYEENPQFFLKKIPSRNQ